MANKKTNGNGNGETNFQPSDVWINRSKSGKGFTMKVEDTLYTGAISQLEKFVNGDIEGVNLSIAPPLEK